ncbi:ABC transporter ATP-binding protein [Nocardioides marmoribigeumensis]|uniref:NitT/TauT family transport system ATP-binding protein n=1 Tax=Nocardioides marmoribigeumensis TaxID=433649 RepID=A0ABU2BWX7_9ACTN|nr:ABC transporter ATP-binding protein [Nocardioides marmoribigeumensis]MDR7362419.1 NitT/TauT family transport system ATP-binding protein [Nocardioides marmoribigeumensis]
MSTAEQRIPPVTTASSPEPAPPAHRPPALPHIRVADVAKTYPNGTIALAPVDLDIREGEFVSLLGPSGCGKSTLLRIIAGLITPTNGEVEISGSARRAFVFQDPTLLPWRTVVKNARLLLELEGIPKAEHESRVAEALAKVGLAGFEKSYPRGLSGGMRMRLSFARALALRPQLFLMDEPFSALDEITRETLQDELLEIWGVDGFTSVFVTHNLYEAVYMSHRVVVMSPRPGQIERIFDIPFDYPRKPELRATPEFAAITQEISTCMREMKR